MPARQSPKIEALVVNAIRRLQDVQGSSSREISNYISHEYNIPEKEIKRSVQLTLQRGVSYGILQRSKEGYYAYNRDYVGQLSLGNGMGDGLMEFYCGRRRNWSSRTCETGRRRDTRSRRRRRHDSLREKLPEKSRRERRRNRRRSSKRKGRRKSGKDKTRVDLSKIEMKASESKKNDGSRDKDQSGTYISEHPDEQHPQNPAKNPRSVNILTDD